MSVVRRDVIIGMGASLAGVSLAAVLADPRLARAAAASLETVTITTEGGQSVSAALAVPEATPAAGVMLVHEWWGLNDQMKSVAAELGKLGYLALAIDLHRGEVASDPERAKELIGALDAAAATDTVKSWLRWLKADTRSTGKVASIGWCFGGGWALNASLAEPVDATVVYYGNVAKTAEELAPLKGPVLGHFALKDQWINQEMVNGFTAAMAKAGKGVEARWYDADHAFANPTGGSYDEADTKAAWERTLAFLKGTIG
ncbi:MAG: dienelactone hydrolase family protein [Alphaproteobacteria bacterium]